MTRPPPTVDPLGRGASGTRRDGPKPTWPNPVSRYLLAVIAVASLLLGLGLWIGASSTAKFFAWTILSPTAASALGGFYVGIGIYAAMAAAATAWAVRRPVFPPAIAGPSLLLIPTAIHHSLFNFDHPLAWLWLLLYVVFPPVLLLVYLTGLHVYRDPAAVASDIPGRQRGLLIAAAILVAAVGVVLLVFPTAWASAWPWPLTPLVAQVYGCWLLAGALGIIAIAAERVFANVRLALWTMIAVSLCAAVGPLLHPAQLQIDVGIVVWVGGVLSLAMLFGGLLWLHRA